MDKSYSELLKPGEKDFWKNFWFYNKKIIITVALAVSITVFGVSRCMNISSPDAAVMIITQNNHAPDVTEKIEKSISSVVEDINEDGKVKIALVEVAVPKDSYAELQTSNEIKAINQIVNGDATVVIGEKQLLEKFFEEDEFFEEATGENLVINSKGKPVAVDITKSAFAGEMNYDGEDVLCLAVKRIEENSPVYEMYLQGKKIVDYILSGIG